MMTESHVWKKRPHIGNVCVICGLSETASTYFHWPCKKLNLEEIKKKMLEMG